MKSRPPFFIEQPADPQLEEKPCFQHRNKGYKKGCKDCFQLNHGESQDDDLWHSIWERDNFGDN